MLYPKAKSVLKSLSPSKVFYEIGQDVVLGMVYGIDDHAQMAADSSGNMAQAVIDSMTALGDMTDLNPTITPVLDLDASSSWR